HNFTKPEIIYIFYNPSFSIYAAIYSSPVGIISNAKDRPCLPDGLISRTLLKDISPLHQVFHMFDFVYNHKGK
ncbi:unnamed protein product, partial [marine sediment metagenome]